MNRIYKLVYLVIVGLALLIGPTTGTEIFSPTGYDFISDLENSDDDLTESDISSGNSVSNSDSEAEPFEEEDSLLNDESEVKSEEEDSSPEIPEIEIFHNQYLPDEGLPERAAYINAKDAIPEEGDYISDNFNDNLPEVGDQIPNAEEIPDDDVSDFDGAEKETKEDKAKAQAQAQAKAQAANQERIRQAGELLKQRALAIQQQRAAALARIARTVAHPPQGSDPGPKCANYDKCAAVNCDAKANGVADLSRYVNPTDEKPKVSTDYEDDQDMDEREKPRHVGEKCDTQSVPKPPIFGTFDNPLKSYKIQCVKSQCHTTQSCRRSNVIPGINLIGAAYDVVFDKIKGLPLVDFTYDKQIMFTGKFCPDQISIRPINTHDESSTAKSYSSASSYEKETSYAVSAEGGYAGFTASVSVSGSSTSAMTKSESGSLASLIIKKELYALKLVPGRWRISDEALTQLTAVGPKQFIGMYGTHILTGVTIGGMKRYLATMKSSDSKKASSSDIAVSVKATFSMYGSASADYNSKSKDSNSKKESVQNVKLWCTGGDQCKDDEQWINSLRANPGLVKKEVLPIYKIIPKGPARDAVEEYYNAYIKDSRRLKGWLRKITKKWAELGRQLYVNRQEAARHPYICVKDFVDEGIKQYCKLWNCDTSGLSAANLEPDKKDLEMLRQEKLIGLKKDGGDAPIKYGEAFMIKSTDGKRSIIKKDGKLSTEATKQAEGTLEGLWTFVRVEKKEGCRKKKKKWYNKWGRSRTVCKHSYNRNFKISETRGIGHPVQYNDFVFIVPMKKNPNMKKEGEEQLIPNMDEFVGVGDCDPRKQPVVQKHPKWKIYQLSAHKMKGPMNLKSGLVSIHMSLYHLNWKCPKAVAYDSHGNFVVQFVHSNRDIAFSSFNEKRRGEFLVTLERGVALLM